MKQQTEQGALASIGTIAGLALTTTVAGPVGWAGGLSLLAASEYYRRKNALGMGDVSLGLARFTWENLKGVATAFNRDAVDAIPVYANVVQQAKTLVDHGVERPEVDLHKWVADKGSLRSLIIAGLPGEGKTHTAKALIMAMLQTFPRRYLKICTLDRGLSHDDTNPETWLGLDDSFFAETIDEIRQEIESAEAEMEDRYLKAKSGGEIDKFPYIVFVDELVATMGMLKGVNTEHDKSLDKTLKNLLVRGPKARVWIMGATQMLDCNGTGMNQGVLKLFEFLVMPQLGGTATSWRNLPDTPEQSYIIQELQKAPAKAPKPVAILRGGKGKVMTIPRLHVPDRLEVTTPEAESDRISHWLESQADAMAESAERGLSATKAWARVAPPSGHRAKSSSNEFWQRFKSAYAEIQESQKGASKFELS
jgi:hypothetical protein